MEKKRGKINNTGKLTLECNEDQWQILLKGLVSEIKTTALIKHDGLIIRIKLVLTGISAPHQRRVLTDCRVQSNADEATNQSISRINIYLNQMMEQTAWIFSAYINGEKNLPIIISYYPVLNIFIYTLKKKSELKENFFPTFMQN